MDLGFSGRGAVVTGASQGLGAAIAKALAEEGAVVCLVARNAAALKDVATAIHDAGGTAHICPADLSSSEEIARVSAECLSLLPTLDALVNCAGATKRGDFFDLTDQDWSEGYALKFHATVRLSKALWSGLKASGGSIVNIAGLGGRMPEGDFTIGGSVNAALLNFTKALSQVGIRDGVRVNAINPGFINTGRLTKSLEAAAQRDGVTHSDAAAQLLEKLGVGRFGKAEEVAALALFMLSPAASYLNGAAIELDGGARRAI
jgi:NAD(P)-dependent dehydrogenase (short-subunit alcohol dehydrogenase family)